MSVLTPRAHDGRKRIVPDESCELSSGSELLVNVLPVGGAAEQEEWASCARAGLARAYGDDEPEYSPTNHPQLLFVRHCRHLSGRPKV